MDISIYTQKRAPCDGHDDNVNLLIKLDYLSIFGNDTTIYSIHVFTLWAATMKLGEVNCIDIELTLHFDARLITEIIYYAMYLPRKFWIFCFLPVALHDVFESLFSLYAKPPNTGLCVTQVNSSQSTVYRFSEFTNTITLINPVLSLTAS